MIDLKQTDEESALIREVSHLPWGTQQQPQPLLLCMPLAMPFWEGSPGLILSCPPPTPTPTPRTLPLT